MNKLKVGSVGYYKENPYKITYFKVTKIDKKLYYYDFLEISGNLEGNGGSNVVHLLETKNWKIVESTWVKFKGE